jgi:hypothetical protein
MEGGQAIMTNFELTIAYMAMDDYTAPVAKKKCYDPEDIVWERKFCQVYQDILKSIPKLIERRPIKWDAETLQE